MNGWTKRLIIGAIALLPAIAISVAQAAPARQSTALVQVATNPKFGTILVDSKGMTLYTLTSEAGGKFMCSGQCLNFWPPLTLPSGMTAPTAGAGVTGTLGTITRSDGTVQVTDNGFPLYRFANDKAAGDTNGEGIVAFGGTWHVVKTSSVPLAATAVVRLTISITTTGSTVWGTVTVRYTFHHRSVQRTCSKSSCTFTVPVGAKVHLSQKPLNTATWPFSLWQFKGAGKSWNSKSIMATLHAMSSYKVTAVYVVA